MGLLYLCLYLYRKRDVGTKFQVFWNDMQCVMANGYPRFGRKFSFQNISAPRIFFGGGVVWVLGGLTLKLYVNYTRSEKVSYVNRATISEPTSS